MLVPSNSWHVLLIKLSATARQLCPCSTALQTALSSKSEIIFLNCFFNEFAKSSYILFHFSLTMFCGILFLSSHPLHAWKRRTWDSLANRELLFETRGQKLKYSTLSLNFGHIRQMVALYMQSLQQVTLPAWKQRKVGEVSLQEVWVAQTRAQNTTTAF